MVFFCKPLSLRIWSPATYESAFTQVRLIHMYLAAKSEAKEAYKEPLFVDNH